MSVPFLESSKGETLVLSSKDIPWLADVNGAFGIRRQDGRFRLGLANSNSLEWYDVFYIGYEASKAVERGAPVALSVHADGECLILLPLSYIHNRKNVRVVVAETDPDAAGPVNKG